MSHSYINYIALEWWNCKKKFLHAFQMRYYFGTPGKYTCLYHGNDDKFQQNIKYFLLYDPYSSQEDHNGILHLNWCFVIRNICIFSIIADKEMYIKSYITEPAPQLRYSFIPIFINRNDIQTNTISWHIQSKIKHI